MIDNAHVLDTYALKRLIKLRNDYHMCAIVLCITLQKNEKMADALAVLQKRLPHEHHRKLARPDPAFLLRMSPKEFAQEVFRQGICKRLDIRFPAEPTREELDVQKRILRRAWAVTGEGDWVSIENLYDRFRIALGESNGRPRTLTPDILCEVFGTW